MLDLMAAVIQTDLSRVFTFRMPFQRLIDSLGFKIKAHSATHCTIGSKAYETSVAQDLKKVELLVRLID